MTFGEKLKAMRTGAEERQEDLEKDIGITKRTVILYERGDRTPRSEKTYIALAEHYKTPIEFWKEDREDDADKIEEYVAYRRSSHAAEKIIENVQGLFAGGKLSEIDKFKVIKALEKTFWEIDNKDNNDSTE